MEHRYPHSYMMTDDLIRLYLLLDTYTEKYLDGTNEADALKTHVEAAYQERTGETLDLRTAQALVNVHNERHAGRRGINEATKARIKEMKRSGAAVDDIARDCNVSIRTVYRIAP